LKDACRSKEERKKIAMIRICDGEVFQCDERQLNRSILISFFLGGGINSIVQVIDEKGKHIGLITYPEVLDKDNIVDVIDREFIELDSDMFDKAEGYFELRGRPADRYCPVLNDKRQIEFFAYYETSGIGSEILSLIRAMGADKISDNLLCGSFKGINIWGINEIGFRLAEVLREKSKIPFAVIGDYWDKLGFECNGKIIEDGYNVYVEGNRAIPISDMGKWRMDIPAGYMELKIWLEHYMDNYALEKHFLSRNQLHEWLYERIISGEPFMAARLGVTEGRLIGEYLNGSFTKERLRWLYTTSGFFSEKGFDLNDVNRFAEREIAAVQDTDLHIFLDREAAGVINRFASDNSQVCMFGFLLHEKVEEDDEISWVQGLRGKKVLVISPFEQTIKMQYEKRDKIYSGNKCLPDFELITYKMIETQNGEKCGFRNFFEAYDYVIGQIRKIDFDVALIAAGAYGYLLAQDIKKMGRTSIELCSYLMPIFGIKIKRHSVSSWINMFWNEYWSFPVEQPVKNSYKIENGCYWA